MKQNATTKKRSNMFVAAITALALLILSVLLFSLPAARAEESDGYDGWYEKVSVTNSGFSSVGSSDAAGDGVSDPDSWTGAAVGGASTGSVRAGVLQLEQYGNNKDSYKLDTYDEFKNGFPDAPFGKVTDPSGEGYFADASDRNVLLINANGLETSYGFTSSSITFDNNSYYRVTVWVKTGENGPGAGAGAAVLVGGISDEPLGFTGIKTYLIPSDGNTEKNLGWYEYTIYIETAEFGSTSGNISLQLGYDGVGGRSDGYAMFDYVNVYKLSSKSFFAATKSLTPGEESGRKVLFSLAKSSHMKGGDFETVGEFGTVVADGKANVTFLETANGLPKDNNYGFEKGLYAPVENKESNKVLAVSTYDKESGEFGLAYGGVVSDEFTLDRYAYYRLSGWYDRYEVSDGHGATVTLRYRAKGSTAEFKDTSFTVSATDDNPAHNGWHEFSIYVKGSALADFDAKLELSLGTKSEPSRGVVLFDDIKIMQITPAEYSDYSSSASGTVTVDTYTDNMGITNGAFAAVETYDELEYDEDHRLVTPLTPQGWTFITTDTADTTGYSKTPVPVSEDKPDGLKSSYGIVPTTELPAGATGVNNYENALKLSANDRTAFGYKSSDFTASASSYNTLSVSLVTEGIELGADNYGANIVLKKGTSVIGTIERISVGGTYTFYIAGGAADTTLSVELWLGLNDRNDNSTKLASGTVYFTEVKLATDSTADIFAEQAEKYAARRESTNKDNITAAAVSLGQEDFTLFDTYDDDNVRFPYTWTVNKGDGKVEYGITRDEGKDVILLHNSDVTYSELTLSTAYTLAASSYYKLSVSVKADIPQEYIDSESAVGAYVKLTSGDYRFDFKSTTVTEDDTTRNEYRTYVFYIKAPSAETTTSIVLGLGGSEKSNNAVTGRVYLSSIVLEDMPSVDYDELVSGLNEGENLLSETEMRVDLAAGENDTEEENENTTEEENTEGGNGSLEWWLVPSILLAVAVIIAIVGAFIRKRIESRPKKSSKTQKVASYDRAHAARKDAEAEAAAKGEGSTKDTFESFDEGNTFTAAPDEKPVEVKADEVPAGTPVTDNAAEEAEEEKATEEATAAENEEAATETTEAVEGSEPEAPAEESAAVETGADEETPSPAEPSEEKPAETEENADAEKAEDKVEAEKVDADKSAADKSAADKAEPDKSEADKKDFFDDFDD